MWGLRPLLSKYGMTLSVVENSEVFGNVSGGVRQGFEYNGLTTATLQMDTQRAFGLNGGLFNASALQIHGGNLSATNLYTLADGERHRGRSRHAACGSSGISKNSAMRSTSRSASRASTRNSWSARTRGYFINTMFGWPMLPSADLPGGGPAYPLSALGVRARAHVTDYVTLLAGVFNGSPVSNNTGDPQLRNPYGVSFPLNGGVLAIAELQFVYPGSGTLVQAGERDPLARTYKIGVWYDSESFADLRYRQHRPLARQSREQPEFPRAIAAITRSTRSRTR